ncbi:hypothetical protein JD844_009127 [Phrynosoma platyrhinos]|uniref:Groucho/TLE N-terminal Q-rich domain-containing protein n=1 Tax=Phrynosoma platyrhinos TaxID=52577 RepID=A0ABQ7TFB7_PHRPL|nr:hypothetical protein JD844_009127 [Phrynosoma platyrhinos]
MLNHLVAVVQMPCFSPQHQQQVAQAVERAKQVTMAELNAIIGVRGLPGLPPTREGGIRSLSVPTSSSCTKSKLQPSLIAAVSIVQGPNLV